ncbi:MAG: response regulator [Armatimonadota bacterium]|nr:response regulator [Armatimonadota bacterium]
MIRKRNILVADDEVNLCKILEAELKNAGYAVTVVHDGVQAVEKAREIDFDIIVLDLRMPEMDGLNALREIRKHDKETPIIIMTAYENHDTMASALSMGATACINKPFDLDSITALVKATLDDGNGQKSVDWSGSVRTVFFNKNQPVLVEVHDGEYVGQYHSRIEDKDDRTLTILCPTSGGSHIILSPGTPVSIGLAGEDAFYSFETTVLAQRENYLPLIVLSKPSVIYRVQRRKHARIAAKIAVEMALVEKTGENEENSTIGPVFTVYTENIGAGGLKIVTRQRLPDGATVRIWASNVPGLGELTGTGRITRAQKISVNSHEDWEYGIQFTKIADEVRHTLAQVAESKVTV